ncbi:hypothetical protein HQ590_03350, partial [bacterium]|nr:hypothetical protein [bacterium]
MRRVIWCELGVVGLLLAGLITPLTAQELEEAPVVREVEVRYVGPQTVNRAVVMANVQTRVGEPLLRTVIEQDVRDLISTGFFLDVRVLQE